MQDSLSTSLLLIVGKEIDGTSIFIDRNPSPPSFFFHSPTAAALRQATPGCTRGRGRKNFVRLPVFHDAALAHHGNTVRNVMNHGQIMGNEDHGQVQVAGQSDEKVQNLGLDGDVQRRNGFIRNDQPGFRSQGTRDGYALALASGKFMGILAHQGGIQAHPFHQFRHLVPHL